MRGGVVRNKIIFVLFFLFVSPVFCQFEYKAAPKIITPNSDSSNDSFYVFYNLPADTRISGKIFNLIGMKMADFRNTGGLGMPGSPVNDPDYGTAGSTKTWEGCLTWDAGSAPAGIYIYQIESGNEIYTGTVVVAR